MLEAAKYPSLAEIDVMLRKGLDFEAMQDENIIPELDISCRNLALDDQIGSSCFVASESIHHEISLNNYINSFSQTILIAIESMPQTLYPAQQYNPARQASALSAIMKPTSAETALTLDALVSKSRDTIMTPPRNLYSPAGTDSDYCQDEIPRFDEQLDILSTQINGKQDSSSKEISSGSVESNESMPLFLQPTRQVKPKTQVRKLKLPDWGLNKSVAIETVPTADSSALQPQFPQISDLVVKQP